MNQIQLSRFITPAASRILRPGIRQLPHGVQRYVVKGGGSLVVQMFSGDRIKLTDIEGGQNCEVLFTDSSGNFDSSALGAKPNGTGEGLKAILASGFGDAQRSRTALERRGINLAQEIGRAHV